MQDSLGRFAPVPLAGRRFTRLIVIDQEPTKVGKHRRWRCKCDCGKMHVASSANLQCGTVKSCGCLKRERQQSRTSFTVEWKLLTGARKRARDLGLPIDIELSDIVIPERCPLLDIPIFPSKGRWTANSPTLDRIVPAKGYVRGNIMVVSHRANATKRDASFEEFERILNNWKMLRLLG